MRAAMGLLLLQSGFLSSVGAARKGVNRGR